MDDVKFWSQRFKYARALCKRGKYPHQGLGDIAEMNYSMVLCATFSFLFDRRRYVA